MTDKPMQPLKICTVFDEEASGRSAEILLKHVALDHECETRCFNFEELDPPESCVAAAHSAAAADLLIIAVRDDRMLPAYVESWLSLCLGLRDEEAEGALVVLVAKAEENARADSSLLDYLETVAAIGGLAFFPRRPSTRRTRSSARPRNCLLPSASRRSNGCDMTWHQAAPRFNLDRI